MTGERGRQGLAVMVALLLAGCAETSGARWGEAQRQSSGSRGARGQGLPLVLGARPGAVRTPEVRGPYLAFINAKRVELSRAGLSRQEKREGERALLAMQARVVGREEGALLGTSPEALYERCREEAWVQQREDEARAAAQDEKLEEYWQWAVWQWNEANIPPYRAGRAYLVTESPLFAASRNAVTGAVLDWAFTHVEDPAFLRRSPSEVALYLLARRSALATVVRMGTLAPGHLDYRAELDPNRATPEQLAVELVVGFIPGVGEVVFALEATTGITITGRQLEDEERLVIAFCMLLPFAGLSQTGEMLPELERMAFLTGRSLEEVQVSTLVGFIPDAVAGNPGELIWGKPYRFIEVKGRQEMALTGNLKAMLDYVKQYGGHVEVWFRSGQHTAGPTRLTGPLERLLVRLKDAGAAEVKYFP